MPRRVAAETSEVAPTRFFGDMVSGMDLTKASHISHIGSFILTAVIVVLMVGPAPWAASEGS
jgi:hypothetical protein